MSEYPANDESPKETVKCTVLVVDHVGRVEKLRPEAFVGLDLSCVQGRNPFTMLVRTQMRS